MLEKGAMNKEITKLLDKEKVQREKTLFENEEAKLNFKNFGLLPGGVPQGMPMSPFLSILCLKEYLSQAKHVNYADDQVFYGDEPFKIRD